jgi:hypothetical protein
MDDLHYTIMKTRHGAVMSPPSQNLYSETMPTPVAATTAAAEPSTAERRRRYIEDNTVPLGQRRETQPARLHVLNHDRPDRDATELASFGPIGGYIRRCNVESAIVGVRNLQPRARRTGLGRFMRATRPLHTSQSYPKGRRRYKGLLPEKIARVKRFSIVPL